MSIDGVISTVGKHIITEDTLTGTGIGICINKPAHLGIIITALQIIQPGLYVVGLAMKHYGTLYRNGFEVSMEPKDSMDTSNIALLF